MCVPMPIVHKAAFLLLISQVCQMSMSAWVALKYPWCAWTGSHLAENHQMTG